MSIDRRSFLENAVFALGATKMMPHDWGAATHDAMLPAAADQKKAYGSGYFGEWIEDEFGLPAVHYTCDQINDPKAKTEVNPGLLAATEHVHQVGDDRLVAIASNYGQVRVRRDEGGPKFLNDHAPERGIFAGGFGYLTDGNSTLSRIINSAQGYQGWYNPVAQGTYSIRLNLSPQEMKRVSPIEVNGKATNVQPAAGVLEMRGPGRDGTPLCWSVLGG